MNLGELTDFELVQRIKKEKCKKTEMFLFEKYLPLINHYGYIVSFYGKDREKIKDFRQDAWLKFNICLESIDLEKIPEKIIGTWKFASRFSYYLKNLYAEYKKDYESHFCFDVDLFDNEPSSFYINSYNNNIYNKILLSEILNAIKNTSSLKQNQKDIFMLKCINYKIRELKNMFPNNTIGYDLFRVDRFLKNNFGKEFCKNRKWQGK
jgi:hypothetical protein